MFGYIQSTCANSRQLTALGQIIMYDLVRRLKKSWCALNSDELDVNYMPSVPIQFVIEILKLLFSNNPTVNHDHFNTNVETKIENRQETAYFTHNLCNLSLQLGKTKVIPQINIYAHNSSFDNNFLYPQIKSSLFNAGPEDLSFKGTSVSNISSIRVKNLHFNDTFKYLPESLEKILARSSDDAKQKIMEDFELSFFAKHYFQRKMESFIRRR